MSTISLDNGQIHVVVDANNGSAVTSLGRSGGRNLLAQRTWDTPAPVNRSGSYGDDQSDFLSDYRGGWHELFPNAGEGCEVLGVHLPYHGEVARSRWEITAQTADSVELRCACRLPVVLERRMSLREAAVLVEENAVSDAPLDVPVLWGHHPIFDAWPGMRIDLPGGRVRVGDDWRPEFSDLRAGSEAAWPQVPGLVDRRERGVPIDVSIVPDSRVERFFTVGRLAGSWAALRHPSTGDGVALAWDGGVFSNLWVWLQVGGLGFPWFGRTSFLGVEPQSCDSVDGLAAAASREGALRVPAGGQLSTWVTVGLFAATEQPVTKVDRSGRVTF